MTKRVVLVTGAGASRTLGRDGVPMPLMVDWSRSMTGMIDQVEPGLARAIGLQADAGPEFEANLGAFLAWSRNLPLVRRFVSLGLIPQWNWNVPEQVGLWLDRCEIRVPDIVAAINRSLFSEFSLARIDMTSATGAYGALISALRSVPEPVQIFSATTNYDRSLPAAIRQLGFPIDDGVREPVHGGTSYLRPDDMKPWTEDGTIPHLHLHGAVGWYVEDGRIVVEAGDRPFDDRRIPAVLYPDPDKDPNDATGWGAHAVWEVLRGALSDATHVLVLGHSLNDRPLVEALAECAEVRAGAPKFGICHLPTEPVESLTSRFRGTALAAATTRLDLLQTDFSPTPELDWLQVWLTER